MHARIRYGKQLKNGLSAIEDMFKNSKGTEKVKDDLFCNVSREKFQHISSSLLNIIII